MRPVLVDCRSHVAPQRAFKERTEAYLRLTGESQRPWPFNGRGARMSPTTSSEYHSIFSEFLGVRRLVREQTWSHMLRAALCDRMVPNMGSRLSSQWHARC